MHAVVHCNLDSGSAFQTIQRLIRQYIPYIVLQGPLDDTDMMKSNQQVEKPDLNLYSSLPALLPAIRYNVHQRRQRAMHMKLFLKGLLVPEKPFILKAYIAEKVKKFLTKFSTSKWKEYVPLLARLLSLHGKKPLYYLRTEPTTRQVISKLCKTYEEPLRHKLNTKEYTESNESQLTIVERAPIDFFGPAMYDFSLVHNIC